MNSMNHIVKYILREIDERKNVNFHLFAHYVDYLLTLAQRVPIYLPPHIAAPLFVVLLPPPPPPHCC